MSCFLCSFGLKKTKLSCQSSGQYKFYHGPDVSRAMIMRPHIQGVTHWPFIEQTRTYMSQPVQRPGTTVGNERHVLQALWSKKDT